MLRVPGRIAHGCKDVGDVQRPPLVLDDLGQRDRPLSRLRAALAAFAP
jgi:hypothetical protein